MYYYVIYNMLISNPFTGKIYQSFNLFQVTSQAGFIPDKITIKYKQKITCRN